MTGQDAIEGAMTIEEALTIVKCGDPDLLSTAGPAVLRLKLLEVSLVLQRRQLPDEIRAAAEHAVVELRKLINERPCVSLVDFAAKEKTLGLNFGPSTAAAFARAVAS
jgi:hypothetical protein